MAKIKQKFLLNKPNSSPGGNAKLKNSSMLSHKRAGSNFNQHFYITPSNKFAGQNPENMTQQNLMLTKVMNGTFFEVENRGKRNNSKLVPSKTQQDKYKIYNSGRETATGPIKIGVIANTTGDGSTRGILVQENKAPDIGLNRTYDTRRGSKTGRKNIKVVSNIKQDVRNRPKIMSYKTSIPTSDNSQTQTLKENPVVKPAAEITKVLATQDVDDTSKEAYKVKKFKAKEIKNAKTEDRRDTEILKKLAEVHSFHQPPLPKLEDTFYSNDISMDDIMVGEVIGQGAYAVVKKGLYIPANLTIAIKIYDKSKLEEPQRRKSVKREIKLMEMMDNEFIVKLYGVIETRHQLFILMEYVSGLSLHGYLKLHRNRRLPEDEARRIYQQLMLGLQY